MNDLSIVSTTPTYGPPRWMISFADLMSVILTFFVLLFSLSTPATHKDKENNNLDNTSQAPYSAKHTKVESKIKTATTDQDLSTNYLADIIKNRPEMKNMKLEQDEDKLTIIVPASEFNDQYATNLAQLLKILNNRTAVYSENIDQSHAVVEKLQQKGLDRNISFFESADMPGKIDIIIYP